MVNEYYQKRKERLQKQAREKKAKRRKRKKGDKRPEKDTKILLKKKTKKSVSIIRIVSRSYMSRNYYLTHKK